MLQQEKILMVVSGAFCDDAKLGLRTYVLDQLGSIVSSYMYILNWVVAVQRKNCQLSYDYVSCSLVPRLPQSFQHSMRKKGEPGT